MEHRYLTLAVFLGFFLWLLNTVFDMLMYPNLSFLDALLFKVSHDQFLLRAITLLVVMSACFFLSRAPRLSDNPYVEELRNSKEMYESILNNLPVGAYRIRGNGALVWANRKFTEMLGCSKEELQSVNLNAICVNELDRRTHLERLRKAPVFAEYEIRSKEAATVWVRDYPKATLNEAGRIDYVDGVCIETHAVDALVRDINERQRLQSMKDQFLTAVTHELRTPLVSIKGYADHIIAKGSGLSPNLKSQIEIVKRNTQRLLELTEDLLDIQYMETGRLQLKFEDLNLQEILTQCVEEIQPLVNDKGQEVRLELPGKALHVQGDRIRLNEVLMNLLQNANKFSPNGGSIILRVEEETDMVTISVTDNGIGINKKDIERVFEPFAAIPKPSYFKGSGLGLSLTKRLVESQGGKIWATSMGVGSGATIAFTLPISKEEAVRTWIN